MVNQHSKRVTKPNCEVQYYLALQQDIFFRTFILYLLIAGPIFFKSAPREPALHLWALSYDRYRAVF